MHLYCCTAPLFVVAVCIAAWVAGLVAQPRPMGEAVWAWHVTLTGWTVSA
jgi:hypothetical protein